MAREPPLRVIARRRPGNPTQFGYPRDRGALAPGEITGSEAGDDEIRGNGGGYAVHHPAFPGWPGNSGVGWRLAAARRRRRRAEGLATLRWLDGEAARPVPHEAGWHGNRPYPSLPGPDRAIPPTSVFPEIAGRSRRVGSPARGPVMTRQGSRGGYAVPHPSFPGCAGNPGVGWRLAAARRRRRRATGLAALRWLREAGWHGNLSHASLPGADRAIPPSSDTPEIAGRSRWVRSPARGPVMTR